MDLELQVTVKPPDMTLSAEPSFQTTLSLSLSFIFLSFLSLSLSVFLSRSLSSFYYFLFETRVLLYSLVSPGTHSVDQAGLELTEIPPAPVC